MSHANRGKALEKTIMEWFKRFEQMNIHCQQNHPEKLEDGTSVRKHGFDFQIFQNGIFTAFDAKNCQNGLFSLKNCKPHQLKSLYDIQKNGGRGFFLVYFEGQGLNRLDAEYVVSLMEHGKKSVKYNKELSFKLKDLVDGL